MQGNKGPFGYPEALGWSFLALAALLVSVHLLVALSPSAADDLVSLGIVSAAVYFLFSALLLRVHGSKVAPKAEGKSAWSAVGVRATHPLLPVLSLVLGVFSQLPASSLKGLVDRWAPPTEPEVLQRVAQLSAENPLRGLLLVAVAACLVPFAEEVFFRGVLFSTLTRSGRRAFGAALVTSLAFTMSHADPRLWAPIGVVALMAGYLRAISGSLLPSIALHVGFNSVTMLGAVTGLLHPGDEVRLSAPVIWGGWLLSAALLVTVEWLARGSERAAKSRREDTHDD